MTLNPKLGVLLTFCDLGLRHTFQEQIAPKTLQIDYNLCMKFLTLNEDLNSQNFNPVGLKWPAHEVIKSLFYRCRLRETGYALWRV